MQSNPWKIGLQSARANAIPGMILQVAAVLLILAYHFSASFRGTLAVVAGWQTRFGIAFLGVGYLFFCGLLPIAITLAVPSLRPKSPVRALLFAVLFWSTMGVIVGLFYRLQSLFFGDGHDLATLLLKVAFDQFVFTVVWGVPIVTIAHQWKDHGYRASAVKPLLGRGWYARYALPMLVMNWAVWIPSLFVIYSMPPALQPHIAGLISGFWSLMCLQISARTHRPVEPITAPAG